MSDDREEIYALLPWYAAGTLSVDEVARVKAAVGADAELQRMLQRVEAEREETIAANEEITPPSHSALDRLMAAIEVEAPQTEPGTRSPLSRILRAIDALAPRTIAAMGTAALVIIFVQGGFLTTAMLRDAATPSKTVDSTDDVDTLVPIGNLIDESVFEQGVVLTVRFTDSATVQAVSGLLLQIGATMIAGPSSDGAYRIRLNSMNRNAALTALGQKAELVLSASPVAAGKEKDRE